MAKNFINEFKDFAFSGNLIELAIGVVIGTGFNALVQSLVNDIIMPIVGRLVGDTSFANLYINLSEASYPSLAAAEAAGAPVIKYGLFINNFINFLILAVTIFLVIRYVLQMKKEAKK